MRVSKFAATTLLFAASAAFGQVHVEFPDAGESPATHQATTGGSPLLSIVGTIGAPVPGFDADVYCIHVDDFSLFSATTLAGFDSQIFLFDMAGMAIAANDDGTFLGSPGILPLGDPLYVGLPAGDYLLGISSFDYDPVDAGGFEVLGDAFFGVEPPTAAGLAGPFVGFAGFGGGLGAYEVRLTGVSPCGAVIPLPSAGLMGLVGMGLVTLRRRR
ncbi:MAG: DVUA0089 family protein [Phycisphaerales bacterium]|nr:DVUA0089 family protein [Phycisphaerales bacterium]